MKRPLATIFLLFASTIATNADWLSFRGNNGVATGPAPKQVGDNSIVWSADVPGRGVSSPIVVGDQIIVTASSGVLEDRLHVLSYDTTTGDLRWHRQFWATGRTLCHPTSANAAPTPASDGENIVAFFSSNDCVCLGLDGSLRWFRGLGNDNPKLGNDVGMASSPMIAAGVVVCQAESQGESFVEGLDAKNGTTLWRLERPRDANWTSPAHLPGEATDMVLLKCESNVSAHDLQTGDMVWKIDAEVGGIPCMAVTNNRIYVPGSTFLALDRGEDSATVDWDSKKIKPNASPIVDGNRLLFINSAGVLNCHNAKTGDLDWQVRVGGKYWASPIVADGYVYTVNDGGILTIVDEDGKKVSTLKFDDTVMGSPAISGGALYVRGVTKLWKVADR